MRKVGSGGFATVWLARDEQLDADVAIKVLAEHWVEDLDVRRRFVEEGRFLRRVESPYVVGVHDIGETDDDRPYLVLTYADRGTLADRLDGGTLEPATVTEWIWQVGAGLQELHDRGLLHRDVKPANVLFRSTPTGERAMVGDLGLGKSLDAVSRITMPGGTPAYVAPEQVAGEELDPRVDQYSLAAVTYAALAGQPPYGATTLAAVLVTDGPPEPLHSHRPDLPAALDEVVMRALDRDRTQRWPDVISYTTALTQAVKPITVSDPVEVDPPSAGSPESMAPDPQAADPQPATGRPRGWMSAVAVVVVLAAVAALAGVWIGRGRQHLEARDQTGRITVRVPRSWDAHVAGASWRPSGSSAALPALLVSADNGKWTDPASQVRGVFIGALPGSEPPASIAAPRGCSSASTSRGPNWSGAVFANCPSGMTTYERVIRLDGGLVRIQVRLPAGDGEQAAKVLDSVRFNAGG